MEIMLDFKTKQVELYNKMKLWSILNPSLTREKFEREKSDYLIISLPASGRTWLRVMIGLVFQQIGSDKVKKINPQSLFYMHQLEPSLPSIKAVHEMFLGRELYKNKNVILLVRNPKNVIISRCKKQLLKNYAGIKIRDVNNIIKTNKEYLYKIFELYNMWGENQDCAKKFMLIKYEDLQNDACQEISRVINFLNLPMLSRDILSSIVANSTFENMKKFDQQECKFTSQKNNDSIVFKELDKELDIKWINQEINQYLNPIYNYNYSSLI